MHTVRKATHTAALAPPPTTLCGHGAMMQIRLRKMPNAAFIRLCCNLKPKAFKLIHTTPAPPTRPPPLLWLALAVTLPLTPSRSSLSPPATSELFLPPDPGPQAVHKALPGLMAPTLYLSLLLSGGTLSFPPLIFIILFIWFCWVLVAALGIFSCGM